MQKIYIVLSYTGTILAKLVRGYTKREYSHVSISLDKNLNEMYSFGRLNPYNPFIGGFVQESPHYGTFKRFKNTKSKIYSLEVSDEQYAAIREAIQEIQRSKHLYSFNTIGLFAVAFHLRLARKNHYYCAEFVKYILDCAKLDIDLPELITPMDFANVTEMCEIYTGLLNKYNY